MSVPHSLRYLVHEVTPPVILRLARRLAGRRASPDATAVAMDALYRDLLPPGALCFDIGANVGSRLASFRRLGCTVVAMEPQSKCFAQLKRAFGADTAVTLRRQAAGAAPGTATMMISDADVLSSLSPEFVTATRASGRFGAATWSAREIVEVVTLDSLIAQYGVPDFIKVDVEGFELEVVRGLTQPVPLIALEWVSETTDNILACIERLTGFGPARFNLSWGESMRLARRDWLDRAALESVLEQFRGDTYLFADVYIRTTP